MHKVFISGSMKIKNLDRNVTYRIDNIITSGYEVIVGDADGVDTSIQQYLFENSFESVIVYCSGDQARNNVGRWSVRKIFSNAKPGTKAFYTAKDVKMAEECDYGLMIWDCKSTGTLSNVIELMKHKKISLVYVNKAEKFYKVKEVEDLEQLVDQMSESAKLKADCKLDLNKKIQLFKNEQRTLDLS